MYEILKPTKVKIVKKIHSGIYIHSHPFGGVEEAEFWFWEALMFCEAEELPLVFYRTFAAVGPWTVDACSCNY